MLLHLAPEVTRSGPPICSSQWTMEQTIGNLGKEIRQPSNPFANLSQCGLLCCQVNALIAMVLDLKPSRCDSDLPHGTLDLSSGYVPVLYPPRVNPYGIHGMGGGLQKFQVDSMEWGMDSMEWGMDSMDWGMDFMEWGMDSMEWWMDSILFPDGIQVE